MLPRPPLAGPRTISKRADQVNLDIVDSVIFFAIRATVSLKKFHQRRSFLQTWLIAPAAGRLPEPMLCQVITSHGGEAAPHCRRQDCTFYTNSTGCWRQHSLTRVGTSGRFDRLSTTEEAGDHWPARSAAPAVGLPIAIKSPLAGLVEAAEFRRPRARLCRGA